MPRDTNPPPDVDPVEKGTLFCPGCAYRARWDGEWTVEETADRTRYRCPACDATVATRPRTAYQVARQSAD